MRHILPQDFTEPEVNPFQLCYLYIRELNYTNVKRNVFNAFSQLVTERKKKRTLALAATDTAVHYEKTPCTPYCMPCLDYLNIDVPFRIRVHAPCFISETQTRLHLKKMYASWERFASRLQNFKFPEKVAYQTNAVMDVNKQIFFDNYLNQERGENQMPVYLFAPFALLWVKKYLDFYKPYSVINLRDMFKHCQKSGISWFGSYSPEVEFCSAVAWPLFKLHVQLGGKNIHNMSENYIKEHIRSFYFTGGYRLGFRWYVHLHSKSSKLIWIEKYINTVLNGYTFSWSKNTVQTVLSKFWNNENVCANAVSELNAFEIYGYIPELVIAMDKWNDRDNITFNVEQKPAQLTAQYYPPHKRAVVPNMFVYSSKPHSMVTYLKHIFEHGGTRYRVTTRQGEYTVTYNNQMGCFIGPGIVLPIQWATNHTGKFTDPLPDPHLRSNFYVVAYTPDLKIVVRRWNKLACTYNQHMRIKTMMSQSRWYFGYTYSTWFGRRVWYKKWRNGVAQVSEVSKLPPREFRKDHSFVNYPINYVGILTHYISSSSFQCPVLPETNFKTKQTRRLMRWTWRKWRTARIPQKYFTEKLEQYRLCNTIKKMRVRTKTLTMAREKFVHWKKCIHEDVVVISDSDSFENI